MRPLQLQQCSVDRTPGGADCHDSCLQAATDHACVHPFPTTACKLQLTATTALSHCWLPQGYYQQLMCGQLTVKIPVQPAKGKKRRGAGIARDSTASAGAAAVGPGGSSAAAASAAAAAAEQRGWADDDDDDAVMAAILAENDCYENGTLHDGFDDVLEQQGFSPQQQQQQQQSKPRIGQATTAAGAGKQQPAVSARKRARKEAVAGPPGAAQPPPAAAAPAVRPPKLQAAKVPEAQVGLLELETVA